MSADVPILHTTVICKEPGCRYQNEKRTIRWPYLAYGVYAKPDLYCECGTKFSWYKDFYDGDV